MIAVAMLHTFSITFLNSKKHEMCKANKVSDKRHLFYWIATFHIRYIYLTVYVNIFSYMFVYFIFDLTTFDLLESANMVFSYVVY